MIRLLGLTIVLLISLSLNTLPQEIKEHEIQKQMEEVLPKGVNFGEILCLGKRCPPAIKDLKIGEVSPNELAGYRFFTEGKLKDMRLGISTRDDMKKLFGSTCEGICNYDKDWNIWVNYFEPLSPKTSSYSKGNKDVTYIRLQPKENVLGTLRFVRLIPKKNISFAKVVFPESFGSRTSIAFGDSFDLEEAVQTESQVYVDGYGLQYTLLLRETFNNLPKRKPRKPKKVGTLLYIEYGFPRSLQDALYDEIKK